MELEFNRKPKRHNVGVRLTSEEYEFVRKLAEKNDESVGETVGVIFRAAFKEIKNGVRIKN